MGKLGRKLDDIMKKAKTIRSRLLGFLVDTVAVSMMLVITILGVYYHIQTEYEHSTEQMLLLNSFYNNLEDINRDVYTYTLEGDEDVYNKIAQGCSENQGILKKLTKINAGQIFYRNIRDVEQMFFLYIQRIQKIYDHSYLCEEMTLGSKAVINKYYSKTQQVYKTLESQFQALYSELLESIDYRKDQAAKRNFWFLTDIVLVILFVFMREGKAIYALSNSVIRPIQDLTENARQFGKIDMSQIENVNLEPNAEEEMRMLIQVYNSMIRRIQTQIRTIQENASAQEKLKDKELENLKIRNMLKTSELKALQMQINPHFLFNTLNMISQTAYMEGAEQTIPLLDSTAKLLRYTLDHTDKSVTLSKEIEVLGHYVDLQEYRFGERIRFEFDLDESFHHILVPSLILQPLVENAVSHGVGMKVRDAVITIRTKYEPQQQIGIIEIEDNGVGIDEERLEEVRQDMRKNQEPGKIGLSNIYMRLHIFYEDKAKMQIYSTRECGTKVLICLPVSQRVKENHSNDNWMQEERRGVVEDVQDHNCR